jgi:hypothetical protein
VARFLGDGSHLLHTGPVLDGHVEEQRRAALTVAAHARDPEDLRELLLMLGLLGED